MRNPPRSRRAKEGSHQNVGILEDRPDTDGLKRAHPNVVAESHGAREMLPADADFFADSQRCRHDGAARMRSSASVVIVGLIGVRQFPIGDGRFDRSKQHVGSDDRADARATVGVRANLRAIFPGGNSEPEIRMAAKVSRMWCLVSCKTLSGSAALRASVM